MGGAAVGALVAAKKAAASTPKITGPTGPVLSPSTVSNFGAQGTIPPTAVVLGQTNSTPDQIGLRPGGQLGILVPNYTTPGQATDSKIVSVNGVSVDAPTYLVPNPQIGVVYTVVWSGPTCRDASGQCTYQFTTISVP